MTTEEKFNAAVNVIRNLPKNGAYQPSHDLKLKFYAYFKQATEGPCSISKPSFWDVVGKTKYYAWKKLGNMSKTEAMENYVEELKKIVETMSYNDNVGAFLGSLGNFYDNVPAEDLEMLLGPVIERVKAQPGSPLQNSPLGSRETSPTRVSRHLVDKRNNSSLENTPISSMSPSPQPPDSDDENEEFIDTVETTSHLSRRTYKSENSNTKSCESLESIGAKEKPDKNTYSKVNGHINSSSKNVNSNGLNRVKSSRLNGKAVDSDDESQDSARGRSWERESPSFSRRKVAKQNGGTKMINNPCTADYLSEPLREAVIHLQKDLDRLTARVRSLEVSLLSQAQNESSNELSARKKSFFPELSRTTLIFIVVWPFVAQLLFKLLQIKKTNYWHAERLR